MPAQVPGEVRLGFPGVGGVIRDGTADYVRIRQQPTALEVGRDPRLAALERTLRQRGFAVQRVTDMDGWLAYHAAFWPASPPPSTGAAPTRPGWPPTAKPSS